MDDRFAEILCFPLAMEVLSSPPLERRPRKQPSVTMRGFSKFSNSMISASLFPSQGQKQVAKSCVFWGHKSSHGYGQCRTTPCLSQCCHSDPIPKDFQWNAFPLEVGFVSNRALSKPSCGSHRSPKGLEPQLHFLLF